MCLAVPVRITRLIGAETALARRGGLELEVNVSLVPDVREGDYVIVHAGFAIQTVDLGEAEELVDMISRLGEAG